jgi:membrane dipeptidase
MNMKPLSRRKFIYNVAGTGALAALSPLLGWSSEEVDTHLAQLVTKFLSIDTHNHVDVPLDGSAAPETNEKLYELMKESGLSAICMTFAVDYQKLTQEGQAYDRFINGLNAMDKVLESNRMKRALNFAELKAAKKNSQPIVIQSVEGGHFLEGKIERLQIAYNRGLRHLGLLHDNDASVPLGDIYTNPPKWGGLTQFGTEVIKECNRLGIVIDLTHCSNATIDAALKTSTKPVVVSHTGLDTRLGSNERMANMMKPRLISKEQAKIVADAGGVIGVWTHLAESPTEYVKNIRALVNVVGIEHVCIGTDTKLTPSYRPPQNPKEQPKPNAEGKQDQKNVASEKQVTLPKAGERVGERTNFAWEDQTEGFLYTVADAMLKNGFTEEEIMKIGGNNYSRVFEASTNVRN